MSTGCVYLVGGGPGDPGLCTVRGRELLAEADVVVYDHLISPRLLDIAPADAERIYVGKIAGAHTLSQDGDALFPILAMNPRAALWLTVTTTIPAVVIGILFYLAGV